MPTTHVPLSPRRAAQLAGVALFGASAAYWAFAYGWAFGARPADGGRAGIDAAWNAGLFLTFGLHHSVMARLGPKAWVERRWPGLERTIYVVVSSLLLAVVCALWRPLPGVAWDVPFPWVLPLRATQIAACAWMFAAVRTLSAAHLVGLDTAPPTGFHARGPYGLVRHPLYSGWLVLVFAMPTMSNTQGLFAVLSAVYVLIGLALEERSLRRGPEGPAYDAYAARVRYRLVPLVY